MMGESGKDATEKNRAVFIFLFSSRKKKKNSFIRLPVRKLSSAILNTVKYR